MRIGSRRVSFAVVSTLALGATMLGCFEPAVQGANPAGAGIEPDPNNPAHHEVPVDGKTKAGLEVVDDAIEAWMRATCAGAVSISLGFGETPLHARGYGYKSGPPNVLCQAKNGGELWTGLGQISESSPFRIGSNTKPITAAIVRDVLKKRLAEKGRPATDDELESLRVFDEDLDLVSPRLRRWVIGHLETESAKCAPPSEQPKGEPVMAGGKVDPRWLDITVGHLLSHRSGLPSNPNSAYRRIAEIRGIDTPSDLQSGGSGAPVDAIVALQKELPGARFVATQTLEEYLMANTDLCFEFDPGTAPPKDEEGYSNLGFGILQHIAEHVSGKPFAAPLGNHLEHEGSLLADFLKEKLGIEKGAKSMYGIYFSQPMFSQREAIEVSYRAWDGSTILGRSKDTKRPHCYWDSIVGRVRCDQFISGAERFNWDWEKSLVDVSYANEGVMPGAGLLAAEMPLYQKFMARYWVSGDVNANYYGRERATNPSKKTRSHLGGLSGAISTVIQFMGDDIAYYQVPRKGDELDLASLTEETPTGSCKIPSGLNVALAANQSRDDQCTAEGCGMRYSALREVVKEALCKVDWLKVSPQIKNN